MVDIWRDVASILSDFFSAAGVAQHPLAFFPISRPHPLFLSHHQSSQRTFDSVTDNQYFFLETVAAKQLIRLACVLSFCQETMILEKMHL